MGAASNDERSIGFAHVASLDGLRAVAILAVLVYHLWPGVLPGGFIGVDLFFVLSGFLLSSLLTREVRRTGRADLKQFVIRRTRRLLPAMLLVVLALCAYASWMANDAELARLRRHGLGALTYTINWMFIVDGTTYTDVVLGTSPLRHVWSLAIEEQFYILLALGVAGLAALTPAVRIRRRLATIAALLGIGSAVWMAVLSIADASAARTYFGTDTRAHALLVGVVLGALFGEQLLAPRSTTSRSIPPWIAPAAAVGAVTLVALAFAASEDATWMFRGGFLITALAAGVVIVGSIALDGPRRALSIRPLTALGVISYGVYLWHWPIIVIYDADRTGLDGNALRFTQLAITLVVATASYVIVERPIRSGFLGRRLGSVGALTAPLAILAVAAVLLSTTAVPSRLGTDAAATPESAGPTSNLGLDVAPDTTNSADGAAPSGQDAVAASPVPVAILGDSVAHTLIGGELTGFLDAVPWTPDQSSFDDNRVEIVSVARPACSFLPGDLAFEQPGGRFETASLASFCDGWQDDLDATVNGRDGARLTLLLTTNDIEDREVDGEIVEIGSEEWEALMRAWLDEVRAIAVGEGSSLVLLATPPRLDPPWVDPPAVREAIVAGIFLDYAAQHDGVEVIDLGEFVNGRDELRYDGLHYTDDGARQVAGWLTPRLEAIAGAP